MSTWATTNCFNNAYINNVNNIDSKYSLKVLGKTGLEGGLDVSGATVFKTTPQFITQENTNVFEAYKNLTQGNAGYLRLTAAGKLAYQDTTANSETWSIDPFGSAVLPIIKNTSANTNYLEIGNNGLIGYYNNSNAGRQPYRFKLDQSISSYSFYNSGGNWFKNWNITNQLLQYYNLFGTFTIIMDGNNGTYTGTGKITTTGGGLDVSGATVFRSAIPTCDASYSAVVANSLITKAYADANYSGGGGGSYVTLNTTQTITGAKTFSTNIPLCDASYSSVVANNLITKAYADATYHPSGSYVTLDTTQTITGAKTFSTNIPLCDASYSAVVANNLITKAYADATYHPTGDYVTASGLSYQDVSGVKNFTSNLRAGSTSGDVFQAFKNSTTGNAGHVLINSDGNLLYYDTTALTTKWNLKSDGTAIINGLATLNDGLTVSSGTVNFTTTIPACAASYSAVVSNSLITKAYADATYHPTGDYVTASGLTYQDVSGVKNFLSNLRASSTSGDVFQAFKNTAGNAGHVLINGDGKLLYYDTTASATKWQFDSSGYGTAVRYNISPTSADTNVLSAFPTAAHVMNDNALIFRINTDIQHYIKYVNYNTNAVGGRLDGIWCQGYSGGVLASSPSTYGTQAHFQWKNGNNYSLVPLTVSKPASSTLGAIFTATRNYTGTGGGSGSITIDNNCKMVFNNGLSDQITIDTSGGEITAGTLTANVINSYNSIINEGTFVNDNGIFVNSGTIYNDAFATYASTASIPTSQSGSTINLALTATGQVFTLPTLSTSQFGMWFYITGDDNYTATIQAATGEYIYNGNAFVSSITIGINETIWIGVKTFVSYSEAWNYFKFCQTPVDSLNAQSIDGQKTFTSIPLCTATYTSPVSSTSLVTKGHVDASYCNLTTNQNITSGIKQFYQPPLLGCGAQNGRLVRIGYQVGTYMSDSNATNVAIGNDIANSNSSAMNLLYLSTMIGSFSCQNLAPTATRNAITAIGAYTLRNIQTSANTAVGTYAGQNLVYGSNNAFFADSCGAGLIGGTTGGTACDRNLLVGNQSMAGSGRLPFLKTTYGGATQTSTTITFTSNLTGIYAGCQIYFFSSASSGNNSIIETVASYNQTTFTVTLANSQTILGGSFVALYSVGEPSYTNTITTGGTGTTFTLDNTNANIAAGQLVSYAESTSPVVYKYTTVSSWNNTTKVLVVAATITIWGGSTLTFRTTGTTYQNRGLNMSDNTTVGAGALMNSGTNCSRNIAIGTGAANGTGNITNFDNRTYFNGQDNVCIGYGAGSTTMFQDANRNIFIGAASGQNGYAINCYGRILTECCGIGYGVNCWDDYQYCFGNSGNYYYFPTNYKMVLGATPDINSSRTTSYETGYPGMLQIVCTNQLVGNVAIACKAFTDTANIINFMNNTGAIRGGIVGQTASSVAYITTSDERKKEDIEDMPSQLDNIQKVKARTFKWKVDGEEDSGFIAQEFYKVYPERNPLKYNDQYEDKLYPDDYVHGMDYGRMTPYLWKGVSELIDIVKSQQKQIDELKEIISRNNLR